jgi:hypothetical protein
MSSFVLSVVPANRMIGNRVSVKQKYAKTLFSGLIYSINNC